RLVGDDREMIHSTNNAHRLLPLLRQWWAIGAGTSTSRTTIRPFPNAVEHTISQAVDGATRKVES
ncbi:MAG TPA: hypothetical protein VK630_01605, partial [Reyranella sp.]|nr:hypothetical protein [Reyranella sp.]